MYIIIREIRVRCGGVHLQFQLLGRLRQEDHKFEASLDNIVRERRKGKKERKGKEGRKGRKERKKEGRKEGVKPIIFQNRYHQIQMVILGRKLY
jgi:hypothetical protein